MLQDCITEMYSFAKVSLLNMNQVIGIIFQEQYMTSAFLHEKEKISSTKNHMILQMKITSDQFLLTINQIGLPTKLGTIVGVFFLMYNNFC